MLRIFLGVFTCVLAVVAFFFVYDTPAKVGPWLDPDERRFLLLRNKYAAGGETGVAEKEEFNWGAVRQAATSPHIYAV